jgi:uncharacterized protein (TIGR00730 family)
MISFLWTFFNNFAENTVFSSDEITLLEDSLYLCKREIQKKLIMNIGIFCSANDNIEREYFDRTEEFGRWCAENGHSIVFGGCNMGLMGCVAEAFGAYPHPLPKGKGDCSSSSKGLNGSNGLCVQEGSSGSSVQDGSRGLSSSNGSRDLIGSRGAKGNLIGVVPRIVERGGRMSDRLTVHIPCDNLSDRKDLLLAHSDVVVALPGGIGTLDEVFTVAAAHTIGYHQKRIILYNIGGFWNTLIALLDDLQQRGMIRGHWKDYISVANSFEELTAMITQEA